MSTNIIGREKHKQFFKEIMDRMNPEFVALYGRRRVGKTFLVKEYFNNRFTFYFTGTANVNTRYQLINFHKAYRLYDPSYDQEPKTWFEAFEAIRILVEKSKSKHKLVFLDELPWMATSRSNFIAALEYFWNSFGSTHEGLKLIVCGSAASWMLNTLIKNKGGLHNRVTKRMHIQPFNLQETELFLRSKHITLDRYEIAQLYFVMGGIPFYLNQVKQGQSVAQVIDESCFTEDGLLRNEYSVLYHSIFENADKHMSVIEALSQKAKGLTREELISLSKISNGGTFTKILKDLELSGFIKKYTPFQKKVKDSLFQLTDPYSLFYHKFIEKSKPGGKNYWLNSLDSSTYRSWIGYAFEYLCRSHIDAITKTIGISGVYNEVDSWRSTTSKDGAQIDLVINRKDGIISICEMKYANDQFEISKDYANKLNNKLKAFKAETKTRKTLFLTMVTSFGVKQNQYSLSLVQNEVTLDDLFENS